MINVDTGRIGYERLWSRHVAFHQLVRVSWQDVDPPAFFNANPYCNDSHVGMTFSACSSDHRHTGSAVPILAPRNAFRPVHTTAL